MTIKAQFKAVPKPNYDTGKDLLDGVPPAVLGAAIAVVAVVLMVGLIWFLRRHRADIRAERQAAMSDS